MSERKNKGSFRHVGRAPERHIPSAAIPHFTGMGIIRIKTDYVFPRHQHADYEVILVSHGTYHCAVNNTHVTLKKDHGLVIKQGDWHEDFCSRPLRYFGLHFSFLSDSSRKDPYPLFSDSVKPAAQCFKADKDFWTIVDGIRGEAGLADAVSPHLQDVFCLQFFWRLVRALPREGISEQFLDASLDRVFPGQLDRLFWDNLDKNPSVANMAEALGMSESSLAHKTKAILGVSPARAFLTFKMNRARHHLQHTSMSVKEIAFRLGFSDPYHFSRAFKRVFDRPPSAFR